MAACTHSPRFNLCNTCDYVLPGLPTPHHLCFTNHSLPSEAVFHRRFSLKSCFRFFVFIPNPCTQRLPRDWRALFCSVFFGSTSTGEPRRGLCTSQGEDVLCQYPSVSRQEKKAALVALKEEKDKYSDGLPDLLEDWPRGWRGGWLAGRRMSGWRPYWQAGIGWRIAWKADFLAG